MSKLMLSDVEKEELFRAYIKEQKCPFRKTTTVRGNDSAEYFMPCDPDCFALIHSPNYDSYNCMRLAQVNYNLRQGEDYCIFAGIEDEDESN